MGRFADASKRLESADENAAKDDAAVGRFAAAAARLQADAPTDPTLLKYAHGSPDTGFNTPLTAKEEHEFKAWKRKYAPNDSGADYDLRGAFKAGFRPDAENGHWPDVFKKPNHETFSNESLYAQFAPEKAGHWNGDTYVPPAPSMPTAEQKAAEYNRQLLARQPEQAPEPPDPRTLARQQDAALAAAPPEVRAKIEATKLQPKSRWQMAKESLDEASGEAGPEINNRTFFGLPARGMETLRRAGILGRPEPVQPLPEPNPQWGARPAEDYLPSPQMLAHVPALATDMAAIGGPMGQLGNKLAQTPQTLAKLFGAKEAQTAVRPSLQTAANAMGTGAVYGATDAAFREQPIGQGALQGAAANLVLSQAPVVAEKAGDMFHNQVVRNSLRGVKQMSKKGSLDKSLIQFGKGDPEEGGREMFGFVKREGLEPVFRAKGQNMVSEFERRQGEVWEKQLKPIYDHAYEVEPSAGVALGEMEKRIRALAPTPGTNESKLAADVIKELQRRHAEVGGEEFPLKSLLGTARDFQAQGHAGVVNYDAPTASKEFARRVGHELRAMANERVVRIYERNPEAAQALLTGQYPERMGMTMRDQPSTPNLQRAEDYPNAWARRYEDFSDQAKAIPQMLAEGNKRYSDYAKLDPLVREAGKLKAGEKKFGLMSMLEHGGLGLAAGALGGYSHGVPGALGAVGAMEGGRAAYPYVLRAGDAAGRFFGGPAVNPSLVGAYSGQLAIPTLQQAFSNQGTPDGRLPE